MNFHFSFVFQGASRNVIRRIIVGIKGDNWKFITENLDFNCQYFKLQFPVSSKREGEGREAPLGVGHLTVGAATDATAGSLEVGAVTTTAPHSRS